MRIFNKIWASDRKIKKFYFLNWLKHFISQEKFTWTFVLIVRKIGSLIRPPINTSNSFFQIIDGLTKPSWTSFTRFARPCQFWYHFRNRDETVRELLTRGSSTVATDKNENRSRNKRPEWTTTTTGTTQQNGRTNEKKKRKPDDLGKKAFISGTFGVGGFEKLARRRCHTRVRTRRKSRGRAGGSGVAVRWLYSERKYPTGTITAVSGRAR